MTDTAIIDTLADAFGGNHKLAVALDIHPANISNWKRRGIPADWRPTIWSLLETRSPDSAAQGDRDAFLKVRPVAPTPHAPADTLNTPQDAAA